MGLPEPVSGSHVASATAVVPLFIPPPPYCSTPSPISDPLPSSTANPSSFPPPSSSSSPTSDPRPPPAAAAVGGPDPAPASRSAPDPQPSSIHSSDPPPQQPPQHLHPSSSASGAAPASSSILPPPSSSSDLAYPAAATTVGGPDPAPQSGGHTPTVPAPLPHSDPASDGRRHATARLSYAQATRVVKGTGFVRSHAVAVEHFARVPRTGTNIICGSREGIPSFSFISADLPKVEEIYSNALVMKFSGGRPSLEASHREIQSWGMENSFSIGPLSSRAFLLRFLDVKDSLKVLTRPSSLLVSFPYKVFRWHNRCHLTEDSALAPVWISLPRLPLQCFIPEFLESVGNKIGRFLCFDRATTTLARPSAARICVELDLRKAPPQSIWVGLYEGFKQPIIYERLPKYCNNCNMRGHATAECSKLCTEDLAPTSGIRKSLPKMSTQTVRRNAEQLIGPISPSATDHIFPSTASVSVPVVEENSNAVRAQTPPPPQPINSVRPPPARRNVEPLAGSSSQTDASHLVSPPPGPGCPPVTRRNASQRSSSSSQKISNSVSFNSSHTPHPQNSTTPSTLTEPPISKHTPRSVDKFTPPTHPLSTQDPADPPFVLNHVSQPPHTHSSHSEEQLHTVSEQGLCPGSPSKLSTTLSSSPLEDSRATQLPTAAHPSPHPAESAQVQPPILAESQLVSPTKSKTKTRKIRAKKKSVSFNLPGQSNLSANVDFWSAVNNKISDIEQNHSNISNQSIPLNPSAIPIVDVSHTPSTHPNNPNISTSAPPPTYPSDKQKRILATFDTGKIHPALWEAVNRQVSILDQARLTGSPVIQALLNSCRATDPNPTVSIPSTSNTNLYTMSPSTSDSESSFAADSPTYSHGSQYDVFSLKPSSYKSEGEDSGTEEARLQGHFSDDMSSAKPKSSRKNKRHPDQPLNVQLRARKGGGY